MVQVKESLCNLVYYVLFVALLELSCSAVFANQSVQVDVHVLENEVNVFVVPGADDFFERYDVGVAELAEEHDLAVGALSVGGV